MLFGILSNCLLNFISFLACASQNSTSEKLLYYCKDDYEDHAISFFLNFLLQSVSVVFTDSVGMDAVQMSLVIRLFCFSHPLESPEAVLKSLMTSIFPMSLELFQSFTGIKSQRMLIWKGCKRKVGSGILLHH